MTNWVDVVARARGLGAQLLSPRQLADLARAPDLPALAGQLARLARSGSMSPTPAADPEALEREVRRAVAAPLDLLQRWAAQRAPLLAPLIEDEDRRSIRALLRGAAAGAPAAQRLAGLVPTRNLPERALAELAAAADIGAIVATLAAWGNPYGSALLDEARRQQPDLFVLELRLSREFLARAGRVAARCGRAMRVYVTRLIDLENFWSALFAPEAMRQRGTEVLFVPGGALVGREIFADALQARSRRERRLRLAPIVADTPLAPAAAGEDAAEDRVLRALAREQRDIARLDPLGPAPIIEFVLRLRLQTLALQRAIWQLAAGARVPVVGAAGAGS